MISPALICNKNPPVAPAKVPNPTTEPTARRGNMSEVSVNRLQENPWWAAVASPIRNTAVHGLSTSGAAVTGTTKIAQVNIAVLRAAFVVQPRAKSHELSHPPQIDPTVAST